MSSTRASTSRLSLEEWDSLSPLTPLGIQSINQIDSQLKLKPIPPHLLARNKDLSRPDTPSSSSAVRKSSRLDLHALLNSPTSSPRPASRATTPAIGLNNSAGDGESGDGSLGLTEPIATNQEFHDWFAKVEREMEREQEEVYRAHLTQLEGYIANCDVVLEELDDARGLLSEMEANYRFVEDNSRALQLACETMLDEQVRTRQPHTRWLPTTSVTNPQLDDAETSDRGYRGDRISVGVFP